MPSTDFAISFFGYKSHVSIDRKFRLLRKWKVADAVASDGSTIKRGVSGEVVAQIKYENETPKADGGRVMVLQVEGADIEVGDDKGGIRAISRVAMKQR